MKRQQRTPGSILVIDLNDGYYCYAQILLKGLVFFDYHTKEQQQDMKVITSNPALFFLAVYRDVITKGRWIKVGKEPIPPELKIVPMEFIQDRNNPSKIKLYNPNTGTMTPTTKEECVGLERSAVWEASHVEDRLRDHYAGKPNKWVESLSLK